MQRNKKRHKESDHTWMAFMIATGAGAGAFWISEITYSSVEGTWTSEAPLLRTHMGSYLAAWVAIAVVFFFLQNLATRSKHVALSFAAPWLLNATIAGVAVVFQIRAYIIVPVTACIALWALYRMKVRKGPPLKIRTAMLSIVPGINIRRLMRSYSAFRHQQSSPATKPSKPNSKT